MLRWNPGAWWEHLTSQLSWTAAWLSITLVYPVCLVDELLFVFIVLLKEMRTLRWCKPRVTQCMVSFPSDFPRTGWWTLVNYKLIMICFRSIGVYATPGNGCRVWQKHVLHNVREVKCVQGYSKTCSRI